MTNVEYLEIVKETVEYARNNGCRVDNNPNFGYLAVDMSNDDGYIFQGDDYDMIVSEYENSWLSEYIWIEDYVIYMSQNW